MTLLQNKHSSRLRQSSISDSVFLAGQVVSLDCEVSSVTVVTLFNPVVLCHSRVVKEEIVDEDTHLPCFNGRVVSWVSVTALPWLQ